MTSFPIVLYCDTWVVRCLEVDTGSGDEQRHEGGDDHHSIHGTVGAGENQTVVAQSFIDKK